MSASDSWLVSMRSSARAPMMPLQPANTVPILSPCLRAVSMTPQAETLMTAVTPPDCA